MIPFDDAMGELLDSLGLAEPRLMQAITAEWDEIAGPAWIGKARPLYLKAGTLVVEAVQPGAVGFLKYGLSELESNLADRFGGEVVSKVEIRAPRPGRGST